METIKTTGKWPCPKKAENVKIGTISNIMQMFNITAEEFLDNQIEYIGRYEERTAGCGE